MKLEKMESLTVTGGAGLTATFISACNTFFKTLYNFGSNLGESLRRLIKGC